MSYVITANVLGRRAWAGLALAALAFFALTLAGTVRAEASNCDWSGSVSTDWSASGNWTNCGGSIPGASDTAQFGSSAAQGAVLTADASVGMIQFFSSYVYSVSLQSFTLTVGTGGIDINGSGTINVNTGTLTINGNLDSVGNINLGSGVLVVNGNVIIHSSSATLNGGSAAIDINGNFSLTQGAFTSTTGSFTVSGDWKTSSGITFTPGTGTVTFDGAADQSITSTGASFYNLTVNKASGTLSLNNALTVTNNLTVTAGTLSPGSKDVTAGGLAINGGTFTGGSGALDVNGNLSLSSGTLTAPSGSFTVSGNWNRTGGTFTPGSNTVTFDGTATGKTITSGGAAFNNLTVNGTGGAWTASDSLIVNGTLTVTAGTLTTSSDFNDVVQTGGTLVLAGDVTVSGNWNRTGGTFTPSTYTVTFDGAGSQTITSTGANFYGLTVNKSSGALSLGDALSVTSTLTDTAGTFSPGSRNVTAGGLAINGGTFTGDTGGVDVNGDVNITSGTLTAPSGSFTVSGNWTKSGGAFTPGSNTVTFDGTSAGKTITPGGAAFNNLTINGIGGAWTVNGSLTVDGTLTVQNGTLTTSSDLTDVVITGGTLVLAGDVTVSGNWNRTGGTFTPGTGTVTFDGAGDQSITSTGASFYGVIVNKASGTLSLGDALSVTSTLTDTAGTFSPGSKNVTAGGLAINGGTFTGGSGALDVNGDVSMSNGTLTAPSGSFTVSGNWTKSGGTFTPGSGTVTFDGTSAGKTITPGGAAFNNLTVNGTGGAWTVSGSLTVNGTLTVQNGTLTTSSDLTDVVQTGGTLALAGDATVSGNWNHTGGTFTPGTNTVTFDGTGSQTITSTGASFFGGLTVNKSGGTLSLGDALIVNTLTDTAGTFSPGSKNVLAGRLAINGGTFTGGSGALQVGNGGVYITSGTLTAPSGDFPVLGDWSLTGGTFTPGTYTVNFAGLISQTITSTGASFYGLTVNKLAGTLSLGDALSVTSTLTDTAGTFSPGSQNVTVGGLSINGGTFTGGAGALDVNGNVNIAGGTLTAPGGSFTVSGNWSKTGGTFTPGSNTVTLDGTGAGKTIATGSQAFNNLTLNGVGSAWTVSGSLTVDGTLNPGTDTTVTMSGSGSAALSGTLTFVNLTIDKTGGSVTASGSLTVTGNLKILNGTFTSAADYANVYNAGTFILAGNITVSGDWENVDEFLPGTHTVTFDGSGSQTITSSPAGFLYPGFYGLIVNKSSGTLSLGDWLQVTNPLTVTAGTFSPGTKNVTAGGLAVNGGTFTGGSGALDVNGNVTVTSGTLTAPSGSFTVSGNWSKTGGTFDPNGGTVTFDGTASGKTITPGGAAFNNLTINGTGGAWTVSGSFIVNGTLTVQNGTLTTSSDLTNVTISGGTLVLAGDVTVSGNWNHTGGTFTPGTYTVTFDGDNDATLLAGTDTAVDFYNLTINKSGSGSLASGLLGYWKFDEGSGTSAADSSGNGNNGTLNNGPTWVAGAPAITFTNPNALDFDGSNDYVNAGTGVNIRNTSFTVAAWAKRDTIGTDDWIFGQQNGGGDRQQLYFGFTSSNQFDCNFFFDDTITSAYTDTGWHHWACTYDIGTNARKIYRDGVLVASNTAGGPITGLGNGTFYIGRRSNGQNFDGSIDDARVYNRALSGSEIAELASGSSGTVTVTLTSDVTITGTLTILGGTLNSNGYNIIATYADLGNSTFNTGSGTFTADELTINGGTIVGGTGDIVVNGDVTITSGSLSAPGGTLYITGNWTISGGTFDAGTGTVVFNGSGSQTLSGTNVFFNLTINSSGSVTSNGSLTVNGTLTIQGGTFTSASDYNNVVMTSGTLVLAGDITVSGDWSITGGTFTPSTFTVTFDGAGSQTITSTGASFYGVIVNKASGTLSLGDALNVYSTLTDTAGTFSPGSKNVTAGGLAINGGTFTGGVGGLDVNGSVLISSGTSTAPFGTFTVSGNWSKTGGTFSPNGGTVTFDGTASGKTITTGGQAFYDLTINGAGGAWTVSDALSVANDLNVTDGTLNSHSVFVNVTIAVTGTLALLGDATVSGNFSNSGTFTPNGHKLTFNGAGTQNLTANVSTVFADLAVSSSVVLLETVEAANASYTGTLTNLGTIRKIHAVTGVGSHTSNLTAATINVTTQGTLTTTQVDRIDSNHPSATTHLQYGKYWNITPSTGASGYTVNLTLAHSVASDTLARVCRYTGSGTQWDCGRTSSTSTTVTRTGITGLSAWTTGDPMPDLTVTKAEPGDPIVAGNNMAYTVSLKNNGLDSASGVALTDTLPSGVSLVSFAPSQGSCTGTSIIACAIGNMDVGATSTVVITINAPLTVIPGGSTIKTIFNLAAAAENETDASIADNTSSVGTTIIRATPGTQTATFTAQWFAGTLSVDSNGNATLTDTTDTLNVALSDLNSDGVYDQLDLSFNNAAYGEGALTDTTVGTGANDERTSSTGPANMAMGVHPAFTVTWLANPGNAGSIQDVSIQQKSWYTGQFIADLNANATLTDTTDIIAFALVDTDSNGLYDTMDVSTNNGPVSSTTFGQGALTDSVTSISAGNDERLTASGNVTLGSYYLFNIAWDLNPTNDADDARITTKTHFEGYFTFDADGNGVLDGTSNNVYYGVSDLNSDALYDTMDLSLGEQHFADGSLGDKVVQSVAIGGVNNDEQISDTMTSLQRTLAVGYIPLASPYSALYSFVPNPGLGTNVASQLLLTTGSTPQAYVSLTSIVIDANGDHVADDHVFFALSDSNSDAVLDTMDISIGDLVFGEGNLTDGVVDFNATNNSNDERIGLGSSPVTSFPRIVKLGTHYFSVTFNPAVNFTTDDASFTALWYVGTFPVDVNNDLHDENIPYVLIDDNSDGLYNVINIDANGDGSYGADEVFRAAGDRWFKAKDLDGLPENVGQYTSIAQYQESNVFISYYDVTNGDLLFIKSTDGGDTFGSPVVAAGAGDVGRYSHIVALSANTLVISYYDATNGDLKAARSTDGGATWASVSVDSAGDVGQFTSMAVAQGLTTTTLYLAYYDASTNNGALKLAKSTDLGLTWPTVTQVDDGAVASNNVGQYAAITVVPKATSVAGDQDDLFISYYDATNGDLWMAKSTNGGSTWTKTLVDTTGDVGRYTSIAAVNDTTSGDGHTVFISYYDASNGDLKFVRTTDSGATTMTPVTLDSTGDVGSFTSLAATEQSTVSIVYYDATNTRLKSIRSTNWGASFDAPVEVDDGGAVGQYASLVAHDTTDLYTAYYKVVESTKGQLRFAKSNVLADFRSHRINVDWSFNPTESNSSILLDGRILRASQLNRDQWLFIIPKDAVAGPNIEQTQIRIVLKVPNDAPIGDYTMTLNLEQVP